MFGVRVILTPFYLFTMTIEEYFGDWCHVIDINNAERLHSNIMQHKQVLCPLPKDVYKSFHLCPLKELRVVILGQDPYNNFKDGKPVATGIAFGNDVMEDGGYSPSLEVLRESVIDFTIPHLDVNFDMSLEKWEKQGVLMLNSALSCLQGRTGIHSLLWRPFIKSLLTNLSLQTTGIVYVLMGSDAQSFEPYINPRFNHILKTHHPSYYARTETKMPSDIWQQVNQILIGQNGYGIQWYEEESSVC